MTHPVPTEGREGHGGNAPDAVRGALLTTLIATLEILGHAEMALRNCAVAATPAVKRDLTELARECVVVGGHARAAIALAEGR